MQSRFPFVKGHGTENDFVLLPDPDGTRHPDLDAAVIQRLTDRHSGLGGDGVIRVVRSENLPDGRELAGDADWFMDYRNADGSVAEMCGNGIRVMARYLWSTGLATGPVLKMGTRGGARIVHAREDGSYTVEMGRPEYIPSREPVSVTARWPISDPGRGATGAIFEAIAVRAPNPHAVAFPVDFHLVGPLLAAPLVEPEGIFPDGANVEFVDIRGDRHLALRVWERGVGETRSCGTGVCAAAWASMQRDGIPLGGSYTVDVPGGRLVVTLREDGEVLLTGPAVLGVSGEVDVEQV